MIIDTDKISEAKKELEGKIFDLISDFEWRQKVTVSHIEKKTEYEPVKNGLVQIGYRVKVSLTLW